MGRGDLEYSRPHNFKHVIFSLDFFQQMFGEINWGHRSFIKMGVLYVKVKWGNLLVYTRENDTKKLPRKGTDKLRLSCAKLS